MHGLKSALLSSALVLSAHVAGVAHAAPLVGLTSSNELAFIDTNNIAGATRVAITGLAAGDRLVGIDLRPGNNLIYGVSLSNQLYTVDPFSGAASFVAALSTAIVNPGLGYGIDFNPVADFGGGPSLRFVSSAGNNYAINANTGVVGNLAGMIAPGFSGVSYSNSVTLPSAAPPNTQLYYINSNDDTLSVALGAFNTPTITTIGSLGIDVLQANGFEVLPGGTAFAALNVDAGTSLTTGIYGINLSSGAATFLGTFNGTLSGLTSAPVPEPGTLALMAAGLLGMGVVARRRRVAG
jgi:Domain of unknown function (DUF4394)/PEP-CTERM motif